MTWQWDWMHTVLAVAIVAGMVTLIALGHGHEAIQIVAALGGVTGVGALFKDSPRQPKEDITVTEDPK